MRAVGRIESWLRRRRLQPVVTCRSCSGTGWFGLTANRNVCHYCEGFGFIEEPPTIAPPTERAV